VIFPEYDLLFQGCFSTIPNSNMSDYMNCSPYGKCFPQPVPRDYNRSLLTNHNAIIGGINMPLYFSCFADIMSDWNHIIDNGQENSFWDIKRVLLHLLLNPKPEFRKLLLMERSRLLTRPHSLGIQLRFGAGV
jgi:hypothetical protein